jgi:hypothetical protein
MTVNTLFTSGNVLTATQQNNFGRGLMATPASSTSTDSTITVEEIMLTYTFTAVNNRNYLFQYFEPVIVGTAGGTLTARIRHTDISGTVLQTFKSTIATATNTIASCQVVYTAIASGSLTIVATLQASAGTVTATRSGTQFPQLYAIDIGTGY